MTNYNEIYTCSICKAAGIKLWRDYNTCASAVELKCATCATPQQAAYEAATYSPDDRASRGALDADGLFTFRDGDQLGSLVPAVTTSEGDTFWDYTSVPTERCCWWHAMPTYLDENFERRCLARLLSRETAALRSWSERLSRLRYDVGLLRAQWPTGSSVDDTSPHGGDPAEGLRAALVAAYRASDGDPIEDLRSVLLAACRAIGDAYEEWSRQQRIEDDLKWKLGRRVYRIVRPCPPITIWGSVVEPLGDGEHVVRYGKEMLRDLSIGDRIAVHHGRAVLLLGETYDKCPSITGQDGDLLIESLLTEGQAAEEGPDPGGPHLDDGAADPHSPEVTGDLHVSGGPVGIRTAQLTAPVRLDDGDSK